MLVLRGTERIGAVAQPAPVFAVRHCAEAPAGMLVISRNIRALRGIRQAVSSIQTGT